MVCTISSREASAAQGHDVHARHHDLVHAALAELQDAADHLLFLGLDGALLPSPFHEDAQLLAGDGVVRHVADAEQSGDAVRDGRQQPDHGCEEQAQELDGPGQRERVALGVGQGQRLGHQLAEDDGHEADHEGHDEQGQDVRGRLQRTDGAQAVGHVAGDAGTGEGSRQEAHEGDAQLDGGQQATRALGHATHASSARIALVAELADAAAAHRHERDLRRHEDGVDEDEESDDDDLEGGAAHQRSEASSAAWAAQGRASRERRRVRDPARDGRWAGRRSAACARGCAPARPSAILPSGTSRVTSEAAPVRASSPTLTGARRMVSEPMKARAPMRVRCLRTPSKLAVMVPGTDVDALAHVGITEVAEVVALGAGADDAVLDLGVVAQLDAAADVGTAAHVREGPDGDVGLDHRALQDAGPDDGALADARVEDLAAGADDRVALDDRAAPKDDARLDGDVRGDLDAGIDEGAGRVLQGDAGAHVGLVDAQAHLHLGVGQLDAVVDAQQGAVVLHLQGGHGPVVRARQRHELGKVELARHRRGRHVVDAPAQPGDVEGIEAGVDLADGQLVG